MTQHGTAQSCTTVAVHLDTPPCTVMQLSLQNIQQGDVLDLGVTVA